MGNLDEVIEWGETGALTQNCDETLSCDERIVADRMIDMVVEYTGGLNFVTKPFAKMIVARLIEKLEVAGLGQDAVGAIGASVWQKLNVTSGVTIAGRNVVVFAKPPSPAELKIAEDIIGRVNGYFSLIEGFWKEIVVSAGPKASEKIIRVVAREAWPEVRKRLGV